MPSCQAFNCTNEKGKGGKSFFVIPNPTKSPEKRRLCQQWITNLKNVKLKFETFVFNSSKLVCEDHFTADSYDRNLVAESLNFMPKKKKLLPTAVPTLINTTIRKRRKAKKTGKNCTIGDKKNKVTDTQTGEKIISRKKKKYKRVITQLPDNVKSNNDERSKMKEVTSSSLANNNMLKDQETQTIENTLHLPLPDNVKSNNDEVKIEGVTSSSLAVNNKIHVDQETQTGEDTPLVFPVQLGRNIVWAFISGSKEGNYSRYMGDNSTSHLLNDQVSVASLQTNNQETDRLNENQSIEPQLDNTDDCLTVLSKTMSRLEDLGVEIAAWVFVPNNNKSSRIHHMGSQRGREFIKSKPVINAQLHVFLQNSKRKGLDNGSSCFKDQQADDSSIQADLPMNAPCLVISRNKNGQKLKRKISSVYMGDHAYCKNKAKSVLRNKLLDHSRQPTSSSSLPAMDMDTFTKAKEIDLSKSFKFQNEEQDSNSILRDLNSTNIFNPLLQKSGIKNMTENTLLLDKHSSTAEKSNLEIRGDNLINKIKEEPVDYEYIEFQSVKPRETVTGSTVHLDTHSSIEKSNLELRGDHLYTHSIKEEPVDYEFIESEAVKPREIVAESTVHLDTHSSTVEKTNSSTNNIKEDTVDYEFTDFQEANNNNNNVTENTVQLDTHSSTAEKSTARLKEDSLSNDIKEEPIDYDFQEVKHRKLAELDSTECSEIAETEQSNTDDFGIRLVFDEEKTESSNNNPNIGGTIEGYKVFLNNANESIHHVTSGL